MCSERNHRDIFVVVVTRGQCYWQLPAIFMRVLLWNEAACGHFFGAVVWQQMGVREGVTHRMWYVEAKEERSDCRREKRAMSIQSTAMHVA